MHTMAPPDADAGRTKRFSHIFARLLDLHHYVWDPELEPFHSVSALSRPLPRCLREANRRIVVRQLALLWLRENIPRAAIIQGRVDIAHVTALSRIEPPVSVTQPQELGIQR
jgi:hypothetical protein